MRRVFSRTGFLLIGMVIFSMMIVLPGKPGWAKGTETLKMGFLFDLTGPASAWFIPFLDAINMEIDRVNAKGGIEVGGEKYLIKLFKEDTHFTSEGAKAGAEKLVYRMGVKYMWGPGVAHTCFPAEDVSNANKVITLVTGYGKELLSGKKERGEPYRYTIKMSPSPQELVPGVWRYIKKAHPHVKRVVEINDNTVGGRYGAERALAFLPTVGIEVARNDYYQPGTRDFYPLLSKMLAAKPDAIHSISSPPGEWGLIIKQARQMGFKGKFVKEETASPEFFALAGRENCEGLTSVAFPIEGMNGTPEWADFKRRFEKRYGEWTLFSVYLVRIFDPLLEAIQAAGSVDDTDKVIEILTSRTSKAYGLEARSGGAAYYGIPNQWATPALVLEVIDGEFREVGTISIQDQLGAW